jgi:hypothetical protein
VRAGDRARRHEGRANAPRQDLEAVRRRSLKTQQLGRPEGRAPGVDVFSRRAPESGRHGCHHGRDAGGGWSHRIP